MLAIAASANRTRARLARDLSRFGKITLLVWALVSTGRYPRPPGEMALVNATSLWAMAGLLAIGVSLLLTSTRTRPTRATVDGGRLRIEHGRSRVDLDVEHDVTSVYACANGTEVVTREGDVWGFVHPSPEDAAAFVRSLGFDANGRRATFDMNLQMSLGARIGWAFVAFMSAALFCIPMALIGFRAFENVVPVVLTGALYQLFRFLLKKPVVTAGVDGVAIVRFGRTRFIPTRKIASAGLEQPSNHARVALRDGAVIGIDGPNAFRQAAFVTRVQALASHDAPAPPVALAREGRSVRAWREHLRDAVVGGYRVAAGPLDALADQLTSRAATPEQRVGAALALRVADAEAGASRVRVAAEHCADALLRDALEAAAEQEIDEAALERALSRLAKSRSVE